MPASLTVLTGGRIVLPGQVLDHASLIVEGDRIAGIEPRPIDHLSGADIRPVAGCTVVPGFVDVHVHGLEGTDVLDGPGAVAQVAERLPRYGVTAFCPTSVACTPGTFGMFLESVAAAMAHRAPGAARVLPAHLESNFIHPDWAGAQPADCLRTYIPAAAEANTYGHTFCGDDIVQVMIGHAAAVGIVTLAPELPGGLDLVRRLVARGVVVSMGHTGATYAQACAAIDAGVTHATHLFNRMTPFTHREPGVAGAVLESARVSAEIICDGVHVHPSAVALAVRMKSADQVMAITDASACAGLPAGSQARLGGRLIRSTPQAAVLDDGERRGTLAGSVTTMDRVFRLLVQDIGMPLGDAVRLCATTPCRQLGLADRGRIAEGQLADLVVLDGDLRVVQTWIGGEPVDQLVGEHP